MSDIAATCFSPSANLLDTLDVKDLTAAAGMAAFPTDSTTIGNDNFWLDENLKISNEATPAVQNDVSAF